MLFNSFIFIFVFFPICIIGYFSLNYLRLYSVGLLFLTAMSLWFYGYFNISYLAVIIISIAFNYLFYKLLLCLAAKKPILYIAIAFNLGLLIYFKYMDFFITTVNMACGTSFALHNIVLPLGISFFTFQQISFIIDTYHGEVRDYSLLEYCCFITFFPQLIAGPIVTHDELVPQLKSVERKQINYNDMFSGLFLFSMGLVKKVIFADTLGNAVTAGWSNIETINSTSAVIVILSYTLQIYFDFSGYCDMAMGLARMLNIELPLNFNSPYKSKTITEFWKRWHMTLTRFLTKYVYIPLGGNRKGDFKTYINIFIVFLLSGLWHGAGFTYIIWGLGHGIFSILTRMRSKVIKKMPSIVDWMITFVFVNIMWVFFRADSVKSALNMLKRVLRLNFGMADEVIMSEFRVPEMVAIGKITCLDKISEKLVGFVFIIICMITVLYAKNAQEKCYGDIIDRKHILITAILLVWGICSMTGISTFLYFNF